MTDPGPEQHSDSGLLVRLDTPLPETMALGRGNAFFLHGGCFHRDLRIRRLEVDVAGRRVAATAWGMPRLDLGEELGDAAYRSGFWGVVPLPAELAGSAEVSVVATLSDGSEARAGLGTVRLLGATPVPSAAGGIESGGEGLIAICMATFNPDPEMFARQIESIRQQTDRDWVCLVSDDCSDAACYERIGSVISGDARFRISRSDRRLGFYRNFERALAMAPDEASLFAFSDQDDRWMPEKLAVLREEIGEAMLVYSDQRIADVSGKVISDTYWTSRRNNFSDLASLLIANTVTGAASLFRRDVVDRALPFPPAPGEIYHDHWVALVALSLGELAYVDRSLYDYVQHGAAALGHAGANLPGHGGSRRWRTRLRHRKLVLSGWRGIYFFDYCRLVLLATVLRLRCGERLTPEKRRALERVLNSERSLRSFVWLATRSSRSLLGRDETMGAERGLAVGIFWRRMLAALVAGRSRAPRWLSKDASPPKRSPGRNPGQDEIG